MGEQLFSITKGSKILYEPQEKQKKLHSSVAEEVLYGGAAGGGKSHALLWDAYIQCVKIPGLRVIIFRRTYPELEKSMIFKSRGYFDKSMGEYTESKKRWKITTSDPENPSYIEFGHCKDEKDVYTYQSAEYDIMIFDELTHFTLFQYLYLKTRLRTTKDFKPQIKSATNPGNLGHAWVCARWRLHEPDNYNKLWKPSRTDDEMNPGTREFIPASVYDNKVLMEADPGYISRLESLPEQERKQLLHGDWTIFSGQAFSEWSNDHLVTDFEIPKHWKRWRSIDFGYSAPLAVYWHTQNPVTKHIFTYRELYATKLADNEQALRIISMSHHSDGTPEDIAYTVADPSIWHSSSNGVSIADIYQKNGLNCIPGNNDRIQGKVRLHSYLAKSPNGNPWWRIFKRACPNLIKTFPNLVLDKNRMEDVNTKQEDHAYDSCRYFFMMMPSTNTYITKDSGITATDQASIDEWRRVKRMLDGKDKSKGSTSAINDVNA